VKRINKSKAVGRTFSDGAELSVPRSVRWFNRHLAS